MNSHRLWIAVLVTAAVVRLLTLSAYPLHDMTEARYAEIARLMVVSGDWITPQIEMGVPFWGKPPLSTWLTAISFKMFGINEFAARLPALLLMLTTTFIIFRIGKTLYSERAAIIACAVLFTSAMGFIASGAVMTDAALVVATTLSLGSFCMAIHAPKSFGGYGFFVGLGLGLLAKGPVALVLIGVPTVVWSLWHKNVVWLWHAIPWVTGSILMLVIAGPWYLMAEAKTPGFLEYFLVGEHWLRFVESGWQGDLYGDAHARPRGTIWLFALAAAFPWSIVALYELIRGGKWKSALGTLSPIQAYLLLWTATPLLFFSLAGNILPSYVLPGLPAFALLLGGFFASRGSSMANAGWIVPGLIGLVIIAGLAEGPAVKSQRDVIGYHIETSPSSELYYFLNRPYSASFYSDGSARVLRSEDELADFIAVKDDDVVAIRPRQFDRLPDHLMTCLRVEEEIRDYLLLRGNDTCLR